MEFFNSRLGLGTDESGAVVLDTRPEHQVVPETIHFAVITTLAEIAAAKAVAAPVVPTVVNINLMSRARPGRLRAVGRVLKRGRSLAVAEGEVSQEERLIAKATVTFAVIS